MSAAAWRGNLRLWLPSALFFALMLGFLGLFAFKFADETELARARIERRAEQLERVRSSRLEAERVVERIRSSEVGLEDFYRRRLSSESQSLTKIIAEIKDLAGRAGIPPEALTYERESVEGQNLSRREITFSVFGTYAQLRQMINFFELSDSFLILEEVSLSGTDAEDSVLRINLTLSTLFTTAPDVTETSPTGLES